MDYRLPRVTAIAGFATVALFVGSLLLGPGQEMVAPGRSAEQSASLHREHRSAFTLAGVRAGVSRVGGRPP